MSRHKSVRERTIRTKTRMLYVKKPKQEKHITIAIMFVLIHLTYVCRVCLYTFKNGRQIIMLIVKLLEKKKMHLAVMWPAISRSLQLLAN